MKLIFAFMIMMAIGMISTVTSQDAGSNGNGNSDSGFLGGLLDSVINIVKGVLDLLRST